MVEGCAVAIPGGDAVGQDSLDGAVVELIDDLRAHAEFLQSPEVEEALLRLFHLCVGPCQVLCDVHTNELEAFDLLHCSPVNVNRDVVPLLIPVIHNQLLRFADVEGKSVFLASL